MSPASEGADALFAAPADERRVARVVLDHPLPHLDRLFDYEVGEAEDAVARPGVRVRVRLSGRLLDGFIVERVVGSPLATLQPLTGVVSAEPVLSPEVLELCRRVAEHYAGSLADVLRLAVPPRHAGVEAAEPPEHPPAGSPDSLAEVAHTGPLAAMPLGPQFVAALERGQSPRAFWQVPPTAEPIGDAPAGLVRAAAATLASGRGALLLAPDARAVDRLERACAEVFAAGSWVRLTADLGPATRYRAFLAARRGAVALVIGTMAAAYAPVADLGFVGLLDDGDDQWAERRAPGPHTREVCAIRSASAECGLLLAGHLRTAEVQQWVEQQWLHPMALTPGETRRCSPVVRLASDSDVALARDPAARAARLPHDVFTTIRSALPQGPVLVQVPRAGYLVSLTCTTCRAPVRCEACGGPVRVGADGAAACGWCARPVVQWQCGECGGRRWRAPVVGSERTAEEIGRAFAGTPVLRSFGSRILETVGAEPALVVATPGAEPEAEGGFAAAVLLDTSLLLWRADLRAGEEAVRRWLGAMARVRGGERGGTVVVVGEAEEPHLRALVRLDVEGAAVAELAERREARLAPATRMITLTAPAPDLAVFRDHLDLPPGTEVLGPLAAPTPGRAGSEGERLVLTLRAPDGADGGRALTRAVRAAMQISSAHRDAGPVQVRVDPVR